MTLLISVLKSIAIVLFNCVLLNLFTHTDIAFIDLAFIEIGDGYRQKLDTTVSLLLILNICFAIASNFVYAHIITEI